MSSPSGCWGLLRWFVLCVVDWVLILVAGASGCWQRWLRFASRRWLVEPSPFLHQVRRPGGAAVVTESRAARGPGRLPRQLRCGSAAHKIVFFCMLAQPVGAAQLEVLSMNVSALTSHVGSVLLAQWGLLLLQESRCDWHEWGVRELRREMSQVGFVWGDSAIGDGWRLAGTCGELLVRGNNQYPPEGHALNRVLQALSEICWVGQLGP